MDWRLNMNLMHSLTEWLEEYRKISLQSTWASPSAEVTETTVEPSFIARSMTRMQLSDNDFLLLQQRIAESFTAQLTQSRLFEALNPWQKLYENFRIGIQLGFQNFSETLAESGESIPAHLNLDESMTWTTWETLSVQLLSGFDQYCVRDIQSALETPNNFIAQTTLVHWLTETQKTTQLQGNALILQTEKRVQQQIARHIQMIQLHLQMNAALEKLMKDPGAIGLTVEMYLWASYIRAKRIGHYTGKIKSLLHITPRIAPQASVVRRLADLRVVDPTLLERNASDRNLKKLHEWAQNQTSRLTVWDGIRTHKIPEFASTPSPEIN